MFCNLVPTCYAQIDPSFSDECRNVGCREEDERDGVVLDKGDIEAGFSAKLDVGAGEEVKSCLLKPTLCETLSMEPRCDGRMVADS